MSAPYAGRHVIAEISYALDRLVCACGAVMRAVDGFAWRDHRNRVGLKVLTVAETIGRRVKAVGEPNRDPLRSLPPRAGICGEVLRNRYGSWQCVVPLHPGSRLHPGQHAGQAALAARALRSGAASVR